VLSNADLDLLAGDLGPLSRCRRGRGDVRTLPGTDHPRGLLHASPATTSRLGTHDNADAYARNRTPFLSARYCRQALPAPVVARPSGSSVGLIASVPPTPPREPREALAAGFRPVDYLRVRALPLSA